MKSHGMALSLVVVFIVSTTAMAYEPTAPTNGGGWLHQHYGTSHAQDQPIPFLCIWDMYCTQHRSYHHDHCSHQSLAHQPSSHGHGCGHHHDCVSGHQRECTGGQFTTVSTPVERSNVSPAVVVPPNYRATPVDVLPPANISPPQSDLPVDSVDINDSERLPPNELPRNVVPPPRQSKRPAWVSWRTQ